MGETALNFGPQWIRELSTGSSSNPASSATSAPVVMHMPQYSLAEFRYGREEMLALIPKEIDIPECLRDFSNISKEKFQTPMALTPVSEEEQLIWARCVNSDTVYRTSGKGPGMGRIGRGGSVDRGRGRGRGGYYQRGAMHDDLEDGLSNFSRLKPVERSLSATDKDHRWDERDRRYDRSYSGRAGIDDNMSKQDGSNWRKYDDDGDWRSSNFRGGDKMGGRGSWRNNNHERDQRDFLERSPQNRTAGAASNKNSGPSQKSASNNSWKEEGRGALPEWSVDEPNEADVGTFDSSGAFLETKSKDISGSDDIYISDDADEGSFKDSPEAKRDQTKTTPKKSTHSLETIQACSPVKGRLSTPDSKPFKEERLSSQKVPENATSFSKNSSENSSENIQKLYAAVERHLHFNKTIDASDSSVKNLKSESVPRTSVKPVESNKPPMGLVEEDAFAHHKKATENMVAQWTEEEEKTVITQPVDNHQQQESKWFYQDPQGEIQGPFNSSEMLEWYNAGYFTMGLMVRRNCDDKFIQLGELIKSWGQVPFVLGSNAPPIQVKSVPAPMVPSTQQTKSPGVAPTTTPTSKQEDLLALQQQLLQQQLLQQQIMLKQAQLLSQLQKQDTFTSLSAPQQQQVLMQQFMAHQQILRQNFGSLPEQSGLIDAVSNNPMQLPMMGLSMPNVIKNDMSMWHTAQGTGAWPMNIGSTQPPSSSIWDIDLNKKLDASETEKIKKLTEQQEIARLAEERHSEKEQEELRKLEEKRIQMELQKEEEQKRQEELQRQREEEIRLQEELRRIEEQRKKEELKKQEELRKQEEFRRQELKKQEELRRKEELRKLEEEKKQEELRKLEALKLLELQKAEDKKNKEEALRRAQLERERLMELEIERQKEALRRKELEREERMQREREEAERQHFAELKKSQGPAWGIQTSQSSVHLSLADIQRVQEEKDREEKEAKMRQQYLQQQVAKQVQQSKNGLSWAKRANESLPAVKSLTEIQQEEAEKIAQMHRMQKPQMPPPPPVSANVGVWGNSNTMSKITAPPVRNLNNSTSTGFWDDALASTQSWKQPSKSNDSAFPALANHPVQQSIAANHSNKNKNVRAKKEEDAVARLFGSHHKPTDEFTKWCTEALSAMHSLVDVPTFVAFLKDIESPYEVHDYVKSYLGENKENREFAKQFLEKRSKFRNQAKQVPNEDNMLWGPAPAITPSGIKQLSTVNADNDGGTGGPKGKQKKKKNKMQKVDSSLLGFTVQPNPDRVNVGEIDRIEGV